MKITKNFDLHAPYWVIQLPIWNQKTQNILSLKLTKQLHMNIRISFMKHNNLKKLRIPGYKMAFKVCTCIYSTSAAVSLQKNTLLHRPVRSHNDLRDPGRDTTGSQTPVYIFWNRKQQWPLRLTDFSSSPTFLLRQPSQITLGRE